MHCFHDHRNERMYDAGKEMNKHILDWPSRYNIAIGAARGISYLHHDCIPHIIHRDIKSSNILLDGNMEARVSDFGLATLIEPDKTHVTTFVAGTFGYLAPGKYCSNSLEFLVHSYMINNCTVLYRIF